MDPALSPHAALMVSGRPTIAMHPECGSPRQYTGHDG